MALLTKCIYGYETNPKKTPFGFLNNQMRLDSIIHNAGWFNIKGERIGCGDLSLKDLQTIAKSIPAGEIFIALNEADSGWNIPSELNHSEPGFHYVINNAVWIVAKSDAGTGSIMRIREDISTNENITQDGVKYNRVPREVLKKAFVKPTAKITTTNEKSGVLDSRNTTDKPKLSLKKTVLVPAQVGQLNLPTPSVPQSNATPGTVKKNGGFLSYVKPKTKPTLKAKP